MLSAVGASRVTLVYSLILATIDYDFDSKYGVAATVRKMQVQSLSTITNGLLLFC
jgi:hypothetical protein